MPHELSREVDELFEVFEPWTDAEAWEPQPTPHGTGAPPREAPDRPGEPTVVQTPPSMRQPRRRLGHRTAPSEAPSPPPDPTTAPAEFFRKVGIPEIEGTGRRLESLNHKLMIQDLLDLAEPSLRVLFWPRPGLMTPGHTSSKGTLELLVRTEDTASREVLARYWEGPSPDERVELASTPLEALDVAWIRARVLDFLEVVLQTA